MRSMRIFILLSLISLILLETYGFSDETDKHALLEFKSQISEDKRGVLSSWNNSFPLCKWSWVTCGSKHKRVTRLDLGKLQLGGMISPSIGNVSFLIYLDLSRNLFGGTIPQGVGNLFRLQYLGINSNFLQGEIPVGLYNCSRLVQLNLESNNLGGGISSEIGSLKKLSDLYLGKNKLIGKLPVSLGNLTFLRVLSIQHNYMEGEIPNDIARLTQMIVLDVGVNNFSGVFPPSIYNISSLEYVSLAYNYHFSGNLRPDFGKLLPSLRELNLGGNSFTGAIPTTLSNILNLQKFAVNDNNLTGSIPSSFGELQNLKLLYLHDNFLGNYSFQDLEFLASLTNCTQLESLSFGGNYLGGDLPSSIANLSTNLNDLQFGYNFISGSIPHDIGNLISLRRLGLHDNMLTGALPTSISKLVGLEVLELSSNKFSGEIPSSLGNLTRLNKLHLFNNSFEGTIPLSLNRCTFLQNLWLAYNKLNGSIPLEIIQIQSLIQIHLSNNYLTGSLPKDVGRLEQLVVLSVAHNKLSGQLPQSLGNCLSMGLLRLEGNYFDGSIPDISGFKALESADFSNNKLSGSIPAYLSNFSLLTYLNLSVNNFEGSVPTEGKFQNASIVSVFGNKNLCGGIKELKLKACFREEAPSIGLKRPSSHRKRVAIGVSLGISLLLLLFAASVSLCWIKKRKKNIQTNNLALSTLEVIHEKISYGEIRNATDGFSSRYMIGSGSFGTIYKVFLPTENNVVAVKVLNMQRRGAMKSFMAECESLKEIRHRNLVKLLTACSSIDFQGNEFKALIYEFMPNGSLDMWLHPEEVEEILRPSRTLTLVERLNIAIDVASVLDYLHVHCHEPIAHCDLKPSNVLLDDDLTAHVSDFGLARLLLKYDQEFFLNQLSSAGVKGTIGYAAPEYGMGGKPSVHGDVYSFGVLLLEMFTGKRPTNEFFEGNFTLHSYTKSALAERVLDIADETILHIGLRAGFPIVECLKLVLEVGLRCCEESPFNRLATSDAAKELITIRERFFKARRTTRF